MPGTLSRQPRARRGKPVQPAKPTSANITSFARVSKVQPVTKQVADKVTCIGGSRSSAIEIVLSRKRKADLALDSQEASPLANAPKRPRQEEVEAPVPRIAPLKKRKAPISDDKENTIPAAAPRKTLLPPCSLPLSTSAKPNQKRRRSSDADSEPVALLERLNLQSSPARKRTRFLLPTATRDTIEQLPQELLDLLSLHTALLKSLSLHYAHNGFNVPVDIRSICPGVAQSWGKRKVTSEDIQRCVGVLAWTPDNHTASPFILCDYGRGKLCIELTPDAAGLNEERLNKTFESNLRALWSARQDSDLRTFLSTLPKSNMTTRATAVPLLVKGRNALDELKADLARRQAEKEEAAAAARSRAAALTTDGSKTSLLDRIRHREELAQAATCSAPSAAELARRAALQRAEDVAGVVGMLAMATAGGRARISFTMAALLVKLRDSLRTPVGQEDGARCVRLLAAEVAPEWLRVVTVAGTENVVIQTAMQPAKTVVQQRVEALLA